jgi:hypothetical protein
MTELNHSTTERGFAVYDEFTDTYGSKVRVQESSSAEGPRVWIFARHEKPDPTLNDVIRQQLGRDPADLAVMLTPSPHLDLEQAKRLRNALDAFIAEAVR